MKKHILFVNLSFLCLIAINQLYSDQPPAFMGDWTGSYINPPKGSHGANNPTLVARIIGKKNGKFEVQFLNEFERRAKLDFEKEISPKNGVLSYQDKQWQFAIKGDVLSGVRRQTTKGGKVVSMPFELKKVERGSPTMGLPAPKGADILIGDDLDNWQHSDGTPATWKLLPDGVMECYPKYSGNEDGGNLHTRKSYADCELHLEFKLPYAPDASGAGRCNSGLFLQDKYEVQILDSYGVDAGWTDCGALYKVAPPKVNRTAPPEQWQTYDITFRAARYDQSGKLIEHPRITVLHNGRPIHTDEVIPEIPYNTEVRRKMPHPKEALPLYLQDHGHPVQFRNFWIREL